MEEVRMSTAIAPRDVGIVDLSSARSLIEQAGREGDIDQLREWYDRLGSLWANSKDESNKAGEVKARIEREIGLIDLRQFGVGHTSKKRPPFPVPEMPKWMQYHCRRLATASQEEFDRVIADLWADPHREICTSAFRVLKVGSSRDHYRQHVDVTRTRWQEMRDAGMTVKQIAELDGVSEKTVYDRLMPSAERKRRDALRKQRHREAKKQRKERERREVMAARGDARGKAYVIVDQQILTLVDRAAKDAASPAERQECNTAYDLALRLRDALYRAGVEGDLAA